jgi:hypothetical protein
VGIIGRTHPPFSQTTAIGRDCINDQDNQGRGHAKGLNGHARFYLERHASLACLHSHFTMAEDGSGLSGIVRLDRMLASQLKRHEHSTFLLPVAATDETWHLITRSWSEAIPVYQVAGVDPWFLFPESKQSRGSSTTPSG